MEQNSKAVFADRLASLRARTAGQGLDGFLVPRADEYLGEYVPPSAERLSWLTGFSGSAGMAVVLNDHAAVMSDGRYALQMRQQLDPALYEGVVCPPATVAQWMTAHMKEGTVGYDPRLHTTEGIRALEKDLKPAGILLKPVDANPVDAVWRDRPPPPASIVEHFPEAVAGRSAAAKRLEIAARISEDGGYAALINAPDSIAWMLNIRGSDVPHNPFALSTLIVRADGGIDWFIDRARVPLEIVSRLGNPVRIVSPQALHESLKTVAEEAVKAQKPLLLDDSSTAVWFRMTLEQSGASVVHQPDPCVLPRACKTPEEQTAIRDVHVRDGVAMAKFLKWLDEEAIKGNLTEQGVNDALAGFRAQDKDCRDSSFDTIAGWAGNGAVVHYRATSETDSRIVPPGLLLVDSGAQYATGTTDITRTVAVGEPTPEMKENFTRVLKGHIAIAALKFPAGLTGRQIDVLARRSLWDAGLDYAHGTGHGVGCYLSVHERGIGISPRSEQEFRPGMLISNEPGYYKEGAYGIRIENLILVREDGIINDGAGRKRYVFETVTLAPVDKRLIVALMLDRAEVDWLNAYHRRVFETIGPFLESDEKLWLQKACMAI